ncbi:excalibur calcium-binding domain-containing protein [Mesorhizobium sp.]|uniref:excalibur calcium-binding domain-containing protein n=1 Tax=Mesorhizobium sp. TaxID=1871066 RepID=UPI000FE6965F|nr:MAG: excalibur calcium-binding domain-containing protein [Mesorhizobium sp.]
MKHSVIILVTALSVLSVSSSSLRGEQTNELRNVVSSTGTQFSRMTTRPTVLAQSWSCQPRLTCSRISTCGEARWYLENCSWGGKLDRDSDGIPCESLC